MKQRGRAGATTLTEDNPIQLIQLTDTHLFDSPSGELRQMNTWQSFEAVLELVRKNHPDPDLIVATGDIAQDGSSTAYRRFAHRIARLQAPWHWIPGNHDNAGVMRSVVSGTAANSANNRLIRLGNWMILLLDSSVEGQVHGELAASELEFLRSELQAASADDAVAHLLVGLHHNPVETSAQWMQDIGLQNRSGFWQRVRQSDKLRSILYGHVHQAEDFVQAGIRCLSAPSTCIQFKPGVVEFTLDRLNPGYRHLLLHRDGRIVTRVHRIANGCPAAG